MRTWEALVALEAARLNLTSAYLTRNRSRLESCAKRVLREIGLTKKEIEAEYPNGPVAEGIKLIHSDPEGFRRICHEALSTICSRN